MATDDFPYAWLLGVFLAVLSSTVYTIGINLQKLSHNWIALGRPKIQYYTAWGAGMVLLAGGAGMDLAALAFAAQTIIAPLVCGVPRRRVCGAVNACRQTPHPQLFKRLLQYHDCITLQGAWTLVSNAILAPWMQGEKISRRVRCLLFGWCCGLATKYLQEYVATGIIVAGTAVSVAMASHDTPDQTSAVGISVSREWHRPPN
jgi:hypothetical protein